MSDLIRVRVALPAHLRIIAKVDGEVELYVNPPVTLHATLNELEACFPALRGTIRDHATRQRRPFLRFFACEEDLSHDPPDNLLPDSVRRGDEPLFIVGAIAGGG